MRFRPIFPCFSEFRNFKKFWNFVPSVDTPDVALTADIICQRKTIPKSILNLLNLKINVLKSDFKFILLLFEISSENSKL